MLVHRPPSPREIHDLPTTFRAAESPVAATAGLPDTAKQLHTPAPGATDVLRASSRDRDAALAKSDDTHMQLDTPDGQPIASSSAIPYRPHHPQNQHTASPAQVGFGVKGPPGGDCKRICLRHQRMVDGGARVDLQKRLEKLSEAEQQSANTIWSLFSSSSAASRILTLRGLLTICCPSQLSFLTEQLKAECRLDPFAVLPRELSLKCMGYMDAMSLGRAAQVSKSWKALADDDLLWRTMCEQHIERKCEKCGWGLPLLERKRNKKLSSLAAAQAQQKYDNAVHNHTPLPKTLEDALSSASQSAPSDQMGSSSSSLVPAKRPRTDDITASASNMQLDKLTLLSEPPSPQPHLTRPWKSVYCERLAIARNWARGKCKFRVLQGHTDAITCLQIDESLSNPSYPVLMTGSWDRTVRIWNAETGQCVSVLKGHTRGVRCLQFDSVKLITGSMDTTLKIWSWRTGQCIRTLEGHRDAVVSLCFDKHVLASGSADSTIRIWDFNTAECYSLRGHREWVNNVKIWSPDSDDCSSAPLSESSLDAVTGKPKDASSPAQPSIKLLYSASDDGTLRVWDLLTRQCVRVFEGHVAQVQSLKVLSVDGPYPAPFPVPSSEDQQASNKATTSTAAASHTRSQVTEGNGYQNFFEQPGQRPASPAGFVVARSLRQATPASSQYLAAAAQAPPSLANLPSIDFGCGKMPLVISGSLDNTLKMWNTEEATCTRTLFGHIEGVWSLDMDKLRIVSGSHDRTIKIWDRASGRCLHTLVGHRGAVTSVALGDDKIISGSDDSTVRIWSFAQ